MVHFSEGCGAMGMGELLCTPRDLVAHSAFIGFANRVATSATRNGMVAAVHKALTSHLCS